MTKTRHLGKSDKVSFGKLDMDSPATAATFRDAAAIYTAKSKRSREAAIETLKRERFLTATGKVARIYSANS